MNFPQPPQGEEGQYSIVPMLTGPPQNSDDVQPPNNNNQNSNNPYHPLPDACASHGDSNIDSTTATPTTTRAINCPTTLTTGYIWNHATNSPLLDSLGNPITVDTFLGTHPLRSDLSTRKGPGNRNLTYVTGDVVTRTLNQVFGHDGWNFKVLSVKQESKIKLKDEKWQVCYVAHTRIGLVGTNCFREDYGIGESTDRSLPNAIGNATKSSITDSMKRAARLFGDKLGNSLYDSNFGLKKAPNTLAEALMNYQSHQIKLQQRLIGQQNHAAPSTTASAATPQPHSVQPSNMHDAKRHSLPTIASTANVSGSSSSSSFMQAPSSHANSTDVKRQSLPMITPTASRPNPADAYRSGIGSESNSHSSYPTSVSSAPTSRNVASNNSTGLALPPRMQNGTLPLRRSTGGSAETSTFSCGIVNSSLPPQNQSLSIHTPLAPHKGPENENQLNKSNTDGSWGPRPSTSHGKRPSPPLTNQYSTQKKANTSNSVNPYQT